MEGFEVVGCEYLPLNNGEVNLNLIEPASVNGGVHEDHVGPSRAQAVDRLLAAMGGTVDHDPENATCRLVGFSAHGFSNQAIDRSNAGFLFAAAEHLGPMHAPSPPDRSTPSRKYSCSTLVERLGAGGSVG